MSEVKSPAIKPEEVKLCLADTKLSVEQMRWFTLPVSKDYVYTREGKKGKSFKYVKTSYVKKMLNYVFGIDGWDFEVGNLIKEGNQIVVPGRLTIRTKDGGTAVRTQFGGATIYDGVELGDCYKKACSLALTKCASEFGFAPNVYASNERTEINQKEKPSVIRADNRPATDNQIETISRLAETCIQKGLIEEVTKPSTFEEASNLIKNLSELLRSK